MKIVEGDLIQLALAGDFDVIIHGCNCFGTMTAGIAKAIQQEFPEAYAADLVTVKGDRTKLGDFSHATVMREGHEITIVNGYSQYNYQGSPPLVDYDAVRKLFKKVKSTFSGKRIAYPKIGAGLAGGDWQIISDIIETEFDGEDHTLVILSR